MLRFAAGFAPDGFPVGFAPTLDLLPAPADLAAGLVPFDLVVVLVVAGLLDGLVDEAVGLVVAGLVPLGFVLLGLPLDLVADVAGFLALGRSSSSSEYAPPVLLRLGGSSSSYFFSLSSAMTN